MPKKKKDNIEDELDSLLNETSDEEDESESEESGEVSEEYIRGLKKKELVGFIEEEGLDIDDYKTMKVGDLRDAVVEAYEENEDDEEDEDEEDEISYNDVMEMDKDDLDELVDENDITVKKTVKKNLDKYRIAVAEALELEEDDEEAEDESEEDEDESSDEDAITEDDINEMDKDELNELVEENELEIAKKDTKTLKKYRAAVIDAIDFDEEEEDDSEEEDEEDSEEQEVSYEDIMEMSKDELEEVDSENDLGVKKSAKKTLVKFRAAVAEALELEEDDEEDEDEEDEDEVEISYSDVMEMTKDELDELVEENDITVKRAAKKTTKKYRVAVAAALELEEEDEEEDEAPKTRAPKENIVDVAARFTKKGKGKKKLYKVIPFRDASKRYHAAEVMMEEARTDKDHQEAATKSHKKAKITGKNNDYVSIINSQFVRVLGDTTSAVFKVDEEDGTIQLLGFKDNFKDATTGRGGKRVTS